jgi:hypothetical protein
MVMSKKSLADKESELLEKITKAKNDLAALQKKQKQTLGEMAIKHQLHKLPIEKLDSAFKKLKEELLSEVA